MHGRISIILMLACLLMICITTGAGAIKVGLLGADTATGFVGGYLATQGYSPSDLTYVDISASTPSAASLSVYDAVLVWSNQNLPDPVGLGNNLADYVDGGGKVVIATFCWDAGSPFQLQGRIMTSAYTPFTPVARLLSPSTLGTYDASSPIMSGVTSLTGFWRASVTLNSGAQLAASWADGSPLAAWNRGGKVVGITLYPGESTQATNLGGDYAKLFANAIRFMTTTDFTVYVTLADYSGDLTSTNVLVELLQGGTVVYQQWGQGTDPRTIIDFPAVPAGTYDVRVSACKWVPLTFPIALTGGSIGAGPILANGDANGDGSVGLLDLAILKKNWGKHG
jgi:hypothetical protein